MAKLCFLRVVSAVCAVVVLSTSAAADPSAPGVGVSVPSGTAAAVSVTPVAFRPPEIKTYESYRKTLEPADREFLSMVRTSLVKKQVPSEESLKTLLEKSSLPAKAWGVALVLYQPGNRRILVVRNRHGVAKDMRSAVEGMIGHKRFSTFAVADSKKARLQVDFLFPRPYQIDMSRASMDALDAGRFEFGVDGLRVRAVEEKKEEGKTKNKAVYFLPGDAFVRSILGFEQLDRYLRKSMKVKKEVPLRYDTFRSFSVVSYQNDWLPLFRGYPVVANIGPAEIESAVRAGAKHLLHYMQPDGRFLYYYDAANDSYVDHEHPKRDPDKNPYYNNIRHCGAVMFLMKYFERYRDPEVLPKVRLALWFALRSTVVYNLPDGRDAAYVFDNGKAKLGGAGLLLHVLMEYQKVSGDKVFAPYGERLARHIVNEILPSGEFRYYSLYLGKPVPPEENHKYFGFYYPGEAVVGLASYLTLGNPPQDFRKNLVEKLQSALHFMVNDRLKIYAGLFPTLPEDSWFFMGMQKLWALPEFRRDDVKDFILKTSDQLVKQMYTAGDALFPDYTGAFFYQYGNHPFPDGARAEGLVAAYFYAKDVGDRERTAKYYDALKATCKSMYLLVNTDKSLYSVPNPEKSLGGIRFKLTRQWFRIDTIAHVENVFIDFLPEWDKRP